MFEKENEALQQGLQQIGLWAIECMKNVPLYLVSEPPHKNKVRNSVKVRKVGHVKIAR